MRYWVKVNEHISVLVQDGNPVMLRLAVSEKPNAVAHIDAVSTFVEEPLSLVGDWRRKGVFCEVACKRSSRD